MIDTPPEPPAYQAAPISDVAIERLKDSARDRLRAAGLLEGAPTLASTGSLEALAPAMEKHCGLAPGSVIEVRTNVLSFEGAGLTTAPYEQLACLLAVLQLAGVPGTKYGFVGNDKYVTPEEGQ